MPRGNGFHGHITRVSVDTNLDIVSEGLLSRVPSHERADDTLLQCGLLSVAADLPTEVVVSRGGGELHGRLQSTFVLGRVRLPVDIIAE